MRLSLEKGLRNDLFQKSEVPDSRMRSAFNGRYPLFPLPPLMAALCGLHIIFVSC